MKLSLQILTIATASLLLAAGCSMQNKGARTTMSPEDQVTTSVSTGAENPQISTYSSIYDYLETIPGIMVQGSGSNRSIYVRGINSINGQTDPLILVDGIEYSDISTLNPSDIASVSVLKDAASCAIYGVRGASGVIIIKTKKTI
ncbi:MAG: TonB-dependent receptor plug domain-containing protein [Bacteroidales bacterium]|nr:TonB-dependent receptor plug domain-containing protein [Bacteroidales bacterium]